MASGSYFLVDDLARLRDKVARFPPIWRKRWARFQAEAQVVSDSRGESPYPLHPAFAYVATGDPAWAERAATNAAWLLQHYESDILSTGRCDSDTWMHAAPMTRRAIGVEWIWDSHALDDRQRHALADLFITDALRYPYVVLHHRIPPHANNQGLAQSLCLVIVGYLFGWRRGGDRRAKHLLEYGLHHLLQQIALAAPGGYNSEGSTYAAGVEGPLAALACATLEAIAGKPFLDQAFAPWGNSFAEVLDLAGRLAAPSGLLAPWNQYGYQSCWAGAHEAFMASRQRRSPETGEEKQWQRSGSAAWMKDDHVWQLLWMPDPIASRPGSCDEPITPWVRRHIGGTLVNPQQTLHLLQAWNWSATPPARAHMHPNALFAEAFGSPLVVDGHATKEFTIPGFASRITADHPAAKFDPHWWVPGSLGAHSCIVIDGAVEMVSPLRHSDIHAGDPLVGTALRHEVAESRQSVAGDVTRFYTHAFPDVVSVRRTSSLIDDRVWLVSDQAESKQPHQFTSQFVLRAGAQRTDYGARVRTAEHVVLDVLSIGDSRDTLRDVPGLPSVMEGRSHLFARTCGPTTSLTLDTLLVPQLGRRQINDWTEGWHGTIHAATGTQLHDGPLEVADIWYKLPVDEFRSTTARLTRRVRMPSYETEQLLLELPRAYAMRVWLDDVELQIPAMIPHHHREPSLTPPFVSIPESLTGKGSEATLTIELRDFNIWGLAGGVRLHEQLQVPPPQLLEVTDEAIEVRVGDERIRIDRSVMRTPPREPVAVERAGEQLEPIVQSVMHTLAQHPDAGATFGDRIAERQLRSIESTNAHDLKRLLEDNDWTVRMLAARSLGIVGATDAVEALKQTLTRSIEVALGATIPAAEGWTDNFRCAIFCAIALGQLSATSAVKDLGACTDRRLHYGLRRVAADALSRIATAETRPYLQEFAVDPDVETSSAAIRGLARIVSPRSAQ